MTDTDLAAANSRSDDSPVWSAEKHVEALALLKSFAVTRGYEIDSDLMERIHAVLKDHKVVSSAKHAELDKLSIELSKITYPVNLSNVTNAYQRASAMLFVYVLMSFGVVAALISGLLIWSIKKGMVVEAAGTWLALTLGVVGAVVYVMLPNGKLNMFAGIDAANRANAMVRVVMGGLLGFVLSLIVAPINSLNLEPKQLLIPLIGGYSITLVVGIMAKAIAAVELTFNIDSKSIRSSLRK
jgi:hypothetical protein